MKDYFDVVVIGAGPAGSMAAYAAAQKGVSVLMLEKDREPGVPVRCGEAVSRKSLEEFIPPDEKWISAKINKFSMTAPNGKEVIIEFSETGVVLERKIFDYALAERAVRAGAKMLTKAYVNGLVYNDGRIAGVKYERLGEQKEARAGIVIAADGVESRAGRWAGLETAVDFRDMESCAQVTAAGLNINGDTCYFYFGRRVAPEGYLWVFPKGNGMANIGVGVSGLTGKTKSARKYLEGFIEKKFPDAAVLTTVAGGVPCSVTLEKITVPGLMLAGDAARQVNPLSGGGIASGMAAGKMAGRIAAEAILENKPEKINLYEKEWCANIGKRHEIYNRLKEGIYGFTDEKFNSIADAFLKAPEEKRTLTHLFAAALINKPSLIIDAARVFMGR
jgi:digeranylgeranylglycerophospholipid reductase